MDQQPAALHINQLPELVLRLIFSKLTLTEQVWNLSVCIQWQSIQLQLFLTRRTLNLLVGGDEAVRCIVCSAFEPFDKDAQMLENENRTVMADALIGDADLMTDASFQWLRENFPGVTTLRIAFSRAPLNFAERTGTLLRSNWTTTLVTLELYVANYEAPRRHRRIVPNTNVSNTRHLNCGFFDVSYLNNSTNLYLILTRNQLHVW